MIERKQLAFGGTAGGWSGLVGRLEDPIQQVAKCHQIVEGNYNAGAHYASNIHGSVPHNR
jgi:hypothetical protein